MKLKTLALCLCCATVVVCAQENPMSASIKGAYMLGKNNILKSAESMPEANYSFKPVDSVRSFGQLVAHIADGQYEFCSPVKGEKMEKDVEKTAKTKAEIVAGLKEAFAYCDAVYNGMTDAQAAQKVDFFGRPNTKIGVLSFNNMHNYEHYGNMATYMRIKGLVPASSSK